MYEHNQEYNQEPTNSFVPFILKALGAAAIVIGLTVGAHAAYNKFSDEQAKLHKDVETLEAIGVFAAHRIYLLEDQLEDIKAQLQVATLVTPPIKNLPAPSMASRYAAMKTPTVEIDVSGTTEKGQHYEGHGSGVIISKNLILTVNHVAEAAQGGAVILFQDGSKGKATMIWSDPNRDVAIMALEQATDIKPAVLANSKVTIGEEIWVVGYPLDLPLTITHGAIASDEVTKVLMDHGQNTAAIYMDVTAGPGNSGGPIYNSAGEVVGLDDFGVDGVGFAGMVAIQAVIKDVRQVLGE